MMRQHHSGPFKNSLTAKKVGVFGLGVFLVQAALLGSVRVNVLGHRRSFSAVL